MKRKTLLMLLGAVLFCAGLLVPHAADAANLGDLLNLSDINEMIEIGLPNRGGISGIEVVENKVMVTLFAPEDVTLVVELYEDLDECEKKEDLNQLLIATQTASVSASDETRIIQVEMQRALPEYFIAQAFLQDSSGNMIQDSLFEEIRYTEDIQEVIRLTYDRLMEDSERKDRTVKLYENSAYPGKAGYVVLSEGCTLIRQSVHPEMKIEIGGDDVLHITNAPESIQNLKAGDALCIIEDVGRSLFDMSHYQKASEGGLIMQDADDYYQFHFLLLEENPRITGEKTILTHLSNDAGNGQGDERYIGKIFDVVDITEEFPLGWYNIDVPLPMMGSLKGGAKLTGILEIHVNVFKSHCALKVEYEMPDLELELDVTLTTAVPLVDYPIVGIPGILTLDVSLSILIVCNGQLDMHFSLAGEAGAKAIYRPLWIWKQFSWGNASTIPKAELKSLDVAGSFFVGPSISASVHLLSVFTAGIGPSGGILLEGEMVNDEWLDKDHTQWHACGPGNCMQGNISRTVSLGMFFQIGPLTKTHDFASMSQKFVDFYRSKTFNDSSITKCPHIGYLTEVKVLKYGDPQFPLSPVDVSYANPYEHYESKARDTYNPAKLYLPLSPGDEYTVTAYWKTPQGSMIHGTATISKKAPQTDAVDIYIDPIQHTITFDVPSDVQAPDPVKAYRGDTVKIPETIPNASGRVFIGWSETQEPSYDDVDYHPGDELIMEDDLTLYAVFALAESHLYVYYETRGGTPVGPQMLDKGTDEMKLIGTPPTREGFDFGGWSTQRNGGRELLQPGAIIPPELYENTAYLRLYAVWEINPAHFYVIHYHSEPGQSGPRSQYVPRTDATYISYRRPTYQAHLFRGWSRNKDDFRYPTLFPGDKIEHPTEPDVYEIELYAVWQADYRVLFGLEKPWLRSEPADLVITANGIQDDFQSLWIDGKEIPEESYRFQLGSRQTMLVLFKEYLQTLGVGAHEVVLKYKDGETEPAMLVIALPASSLPPLTDDPAQPVLYAALMAASFTIALAVRRRRSYKKQL